jgi:hypothetical protein
MIVVELVKFNPYMNKDSVKEWQCVTEEKARSIVNAQSAAHRIPTNCISDVRDEEGNLLKIVMRPGAAVQAPVPPPQSSTPEGPIFAPAADVATENEECALLAEALLGKNNNLALLIRRRMASQTALDESENVG